MPDPNLNPDAGREVARLRAALADADLTIHELQAQLTNMRAIAESLAGMVAHKMRGEPCP
jgi:hypothetical protein